MKSANLDLIKKINRDLVLETIRTDQPISRASIAKKIGLSRSTVTSIVDELIAKKFISEIGLGNSTREGGRRAIQLGFNPRSAFGIGVELTAKGYFIGISDLDGNIVSQARFPMTSSLEQIRDHILKTVDQAKISLEKVISVGFCVPGLTNSVDGIVVDAPELNWKDVHLAERFSRFLDKPIYVNNDVNCAALGERWLGAGQNLDDFVYISIGTGIGSAIVANGKLVQGKDFMAGELGYFAFEKDLLASKINTLGEFGTFDRKVSANALSQQAESLEKLFDQYRKGEAQAVKILQNFTNHLALAIANLVSLLNPEKVIIGGEMKAFMHHLLPEISRLVEKITPIRTQIELTQVGDNCGVLGVVAFSFESVRDVIH